MKRKGVISLKGKIIITISLLIILILTISNIISMEYRSKQFQYYLEEHSTALVEAQALALRNPLWEYDKESAQAALQGLLRHPAFVSATVLDEQGREFSKLNTPESSLAPGETIFGIHQDIYFSTALNQKRKVGNLSVHLSNRHILKELQKEKVEAIYELLIFLVVLIGSLFIAIGKFTVPIERMSKIIRQSAVGDHSGEVLSQYLKRRDEIGDIARSIKLDQQQRLDEIKILEISTSIAQEINLDQLLHKITEATSDLLEAEKSRLFLYDPTKETLYLHSKSEDQDLLPIKPGQGIIGKVFLEKKTILVKDVSEEKDFNPDVERVTQFQTQNLLATPLINKEGKCIGILEALNSKKTRFSTRDKRRIESLASQTTVAIEQIRLFDHYVEKQKLKKAMEIAQEVQKSFLPKDKAQEKNYELVGWNLSCDETGGDYYDYFDLPGNKFAITIGDVTGHGIGPAFVMVTGRAFLRALALQALPIVELMNQLNLLLEGDTEDDQFMTLFYGELDKDRVLRYANAGHDCPLLYRQSEKEFIELESTGIPLGMMDDFEYEEAEPIQIHSGDVLILSTDGITEAMNPQGDQFGEKRLAETILSCIEQPAVEIIKKCYSEVQAFCSGANQRDDLTLVVAKFTERGVDTRSLKGLKLETS